MLKPLALAAMIALAGPAAAQTTTEAQGTTETPAETPAEAPAAATGEALETYVDEVFVDWQRECIRLPEGQEGDDPCRMAQTIFDAEQKPVGKIAMNRTPAGSAAAASGELALPVDLGILLPQGLTVGVDQGLSKQYDFYMCMPSGCIARLLFNADDVQAFKAGDVMNLSLVAFLPPNRQATRIQIPVSLKGFTAAFDSLPTPVAAAQ
jgi:invasion protein IalB